MDIHNFPTINASLNACAAVLLFYGRIAIKANRRELHRNVMVAALSVSALFLSCYLYYHFNVPGVTKYQGEGIARLIYFFILITHIPLAGLMVPFILAAVYFAFRGNFEKHVKLVKWVWPVWMYVSITGVLIYLMLYVF